MMDKADLVAEQKLQQQIDGVTLLRQLRDEAKAILQHVDNIDEHTSDLEWEDLSETVSELTGLLGDLKLVEQALLRVQLAFEATCE